MHMVKNVEVDLPGSVFVRALGMVVGGISQAQRIIIQVNNFDIRSLQESHRVFIDPVSNMIHQAGDAGIDQRFGAIDTRKMCHVTGTAPRGYAV
jgi:hypothetical protein